MLFLLSSYFFAYQPSMVYLGFLDLLLTNLVHFCYMEWNCVSGTGYVQHSYCLSCTLCHVYNSDYYC